MNVFVIPVHKVQTSGRTLWTAYVYDETGIDIISPCPKTKHLFKRNSNYRARNVWALETEGFNQEGDIRENVELIAHLKFGVENISVIMVDGGYPKEL